MWGGFVGEAIYSRIIGCFFIADNKSTLNLEGQIVGGFAGTFQQINMSSCSCRLDNNSSLIMIIDCRIAGGFVGEAVQSNITYCSFISVNTSSIFISCITSCGGFVGELNVDTKMTSCSFHTDSSTLNLSSYYCGGFIGVYTYGSIITCSFVSENLSKITISGTNVGGFVGVTHNINYTIMKSCTLLMNSSIINISGEIIYGFGENVDTCTCDYICNAVLLFTADDIIYGYAYNALNTNTLNITGSDAIFTAPLVYILTDSYVSDMTVKIESLTINSNEIFLNGKTITSSDILIYDGIFSNTITSYPPGISSVLYKTPSFYYENAEQISVIEYTTKLVYYKTNDTICDTVCYQSISNTDSPLFDIILLSSQKTILLTTNTTYTPSQSPLSNIVLVGIESDIPSISPYIGAYVKVSTTNSVSIENDPIDDMSSVYYKCMNRTVSITDNQFCTILTDSILSYITFDITSSLTGTGILCDTVTNSVISNVKINSSIVSLSDTMSPVGGFVGSVTNSCIKSCSLHITDVFILDSVFECGGFIGKTDNKSNITRCDLYVTDTSICTLTGSSVGGFIGSGYIKSKCSHEYKNNVSIEFKGDITGGFFGSSSLILDGCSSLYEGNQLIKHDSTIASGGFGGDPSTIGNNIITVYSNNIIIQIVSLMYAAGFVGYDINIGNNCISKYENNGTIEIQGLKLSSLYSCYSILIGDNNESIIIGTTVNITVGYPATEVSSLFISQGPSVIGQGNKSVIEYNTDLLIQSVVLTSCFSVDNITQGINNSSKISNNGTVMIKSDGDVYGYTGNTQIIFNTSEYKCNTNLTFQSGNTLYLLGVGADSTDNTQYICNTKTTLNAPIIYLISTNPVYNYKIHLSDIIVINSTNIFMTPTITDSNIFMYGELIVDIDSFIQISSIIKLLYSVNNLTAYNYPVQISVETYKLTKPSYKLSDTQCYTPSFSSSLCITPIQYSDVSTCCNITSKISAYLKRYKSLKLQEFRYQLSVGIIPLECCKCDIACSPIILCYKSSVDLLLVHNLLVPPESYNYTHCNTLNLYNGNASTYNSLKLLYPNIVERKLLDTNYYIDNQELQKLLNGGIILIGDDTSCNSECDVFSRLLHVISETFNPTNIFSVLYTLINDGIVIWRSDDGKCINMSSVSMYDALYYVPIV